MLTKLLSKYLSNKYLTNNNFPGREAGRRCRRSRGAHAPAAHAAAVDPDLCARAEPQVGRRRSRRALLQLAPALQARPARLVRDMRARAQRGIRARCEYTSLLIHVTV